MELQAYSNTLTFSIHFERISASHNHSTTKNSPNDIEATLPISSSSKSSSIFCADDDNQMLKAPRPLTKRELFKTQEEKKESLSMHLLKYEDTMLDLITTWFETIIFPIFDGLPTKKALIMLCIPIPYYFEDVHIMLLMYAMENGVNLNIDKKRNQDPCDINTIFIYLTNEHYLGETYYTPTSYKSMLAIKSKRINRSSWLETLRTAYPTDNPNWDLSYSIGYINLEGL